MGTAVWMSKYGDLNISIAQLEESVWPICGDETTLDKETCLYAVPSYLEHLLDGRECCLRDLKHVLCVHRRFLSRCVAQAMFLSQLHRHLATMLAPILGQT